MWRNILYAVAGFVLFAIIGYIVVAAAIFAAWALMGVRDSDGGAGMALIYGIAPAAGLACGVVGAALGLRFALRRPVGSENSGRDRRIVFSLAAAAAGAFVGFQLANVVAILVRPWIFEHRILFRIFELSHVVIMPLCAILAGWLAARRSGKKRAE